MGWTVTLSQPGRTHNEAISVCVPGAPPTAYTCHLVNGATATTAKLLHCAALKNWSPPREYKIIEYIHAKSRAQTIELV